jgi:hypothetical protein
MSSGCLALGVSSAPGRNRVLCAAVPRTQSQGGNSQRWCLARTSLKSNVVGLMEAGYFSGTMHSSSCHLLVDLEKTSVAEVANWRRLGWLGEVVLGVDGAGDVWEMEEACNELEACDETKPKALVGVYRRVKDSEDAAGLIAVCRFMLMYQHAQDGCDTSYHLTLSQSFGSDYHDLTSSSLSHCRR